MPRRSAWPDEHFRLFGLEPAPNRIVNIAGLRREAAFALEVMERGVRGRFTCDYRVKLADRVHAFHAVGEAPGKGTTIRVRLPL